MEVLTGFTPDSSPQRAPTLEPCEVEDGLSVLHSLLGAINGISPLSGSLFLVISPTVAAAVGFAKLVMMSGIGLSSGTLCTCSFWRNVITSRGVLSPAV